MRKLVVIVIGLLLSNFAIASDQLFTVSEKSEALMSLHSAQDLIDSSNLVLSSENSAELKKLLLDSGIDLASKLPFVYRNGNLYLDGKKIEIVGKTVKYNGVVFEYNFNRSVKQNYESLLEKSDVKGKSVLFSLLVPTAFAQLGDNKERLRRVGGNLALIAVVGLFFGASPMIVAGTVMLAGAVALASLISKDGLLEGLKTAKNFKCNETGWSMTMSDGAIINGSFAKAKLNSLAISLGADSRNPPEVRFEIISKSGERELRDNEAVNRDQEKFFHDKNKLCKPEYASALKELNEKLQAGITEKDIKGLELPARK
jgi:hypothetical protein